LEKRPAALCAGQLGQRLGRYRLFHDGV